MRKYLLHGVRLLHGFFVLSTMYCMIYEQITQDTKTAFFYSLVFYPVLVLCSAGIRKAPKMLHYLLLCVLLSIGTVVFGRALAFDMADQVILFVFVFAVMFFYLAARAAKKKCWLEVPVYWTLIFYFIACIYGAYFKSEFFTALVSFYAGCSFLIVNIFINTEELGGLLHSYQSLERLPVSRIRKNNRRMLWIQSVVIAAAMGIAPYLKLDTLFFRLGELLRSFFIWLFHFIKREEVETVQDIFPENQDMGFGFPAVEEETGLFTEIMEKLLQFLSWVLFAAFVFLLVFVMIRKLRKLYRQFNEPLEENGDLIEDLRADGKEEDKLSKRQEKKESLFFRFSPDARIRKHYKKRVLKENKEGIKYFWTPRELEEAVSLSEEKKEKFHRYYEKARYAKESCTKEEMQEMMEY